MVAWLAKASLGQLLLVFGGGVVASLVFDKHGQPGRGCARQPRARCASSRALGGPSPAAAGPCDVMISNGVINLSVGKTAGAGEVASFHPARAWLGERAELRQRTVWLVHGLQEAVDGPIADLGAVDDPLLDGLS